MPLPHLTDLLGRTQWSQLAEQKLALVQNVSGARRSVETFRAMNMHDEADLVVQHLQDLEGLLTFLDALQEAAQHDGLPGVFPLGAGPRETP